MRVTSRDQHAESISQHLVGTWWELAVASWRLFYLQAVCTLKTGTRSVCKQKKMCGGEEPISSSTADSLVNRQEAPRQYYSDARREGTAGTHDSADAFLLFCSCRIGVTDRLLFLPSPLSSHLQLLYYTQTKSSPIKICQMDVLLESSLCAMKNRTR